jgi:hypothetical protein
MSATLDYIGTFGAADCGMPLEWFGEIVSPPNRVFVVPARQATFVVPPRNNVFLASLN